MVGSSVEDQIRTFLSRTFLFDFGNDITLDSDLFDAGLIDSYGFIELVGFLEQSFGIKLTDDDMASPEMGSAAGMARVVAARRQPA